MPDFPNPDPVVFFIYAESLWILQTQRPYLPSKPFFVSGELLKKFLKKTGGFRKNFRQDLTVVYRHAK